MVSEIAGRIPRHVCRTDLVSAGMAGLAQAAKSYQPDRGVTFQRFASSRIRGAILDELRARDWASRSVRAKARDLAQTTDQLTARLGRQPSAAELATAMGSSADELDAINADVYRALVLNLDALPVEGKSEESLFSGTPAPEDDVLDNEKRAYLVAAVDTLPERLRRVVVGYFFEELPMQLLAEELGVTDSRISQMRAEALVLLRDAINAQLDPDLVPPEPPNGWPSAVMPTTRPWPLTTTTAGASSPRPANWPAWSSAATSPPWPRPGPQISAEVPAEISGSGCGRRSGLR